ncbi:MAG: hypothetical protein SU899_06070 [Chloroflexota bacterium]|nr:hypothetical protein [Chloroflexota bacterium]
MRISATTNWDSSLLASLIEIEAVKQIYDVLPTTSIGTGSAAVFILETTLDQAQKYIKAGE